MTFIEVLDLKKTYHQKHVETHVLTGVNFSIDQGEFVFIVGPSGSGKTTLLYVLSGLEKYESGSVLLFGQELATYQKKMIADIRAKRIGFVFQFYNLIPNLTVLENVMLANVIGKQKREEEVIDLIEKVGMRDYLNRYPSELSGGEQQRIAIARSLVNDPDIIFADEPTGNLDEKTSYAIMQLFKKLHQELNMTIVMVTHNDALTSYGTRKLSMHDGKVINDEKMV